MTMMLLAGYSLLALPADFLFDQERVTGLAWTVLVLASAGFVLTTTMVWFGDDPPEALAKSVGTVAALAVASAQVAAFTARRREHDPVSVSRLFAASTALALVLALAVGAAVWAEIDASGLPRARQQPCSTSSSSFSNRSRAHRRAPTTHRLQVQLEGGKQVDR